MPLIQLNQPRPIYIFPFTGLNQRVSRVMLISKAVLIFWELNLSSRLCRLSDFIAFRFRNVKYPGFLCGENLAKCLQNVQTVERVRGHWVTREKCFPQRSTTTQLM